MIKLINTTIFIKHVLNKNHLLLLHPFLDLVNVIESTKSLAISAAAFTNGVLVDKFGDNP